MLFPQSSMIDEHFEFIVILLGIIAFIVLIYRIVFDIYCAKTYFSKIDDFNEALKKNKNK